MNLTRSGFPGRAAVAGALMAIACLGLIPDLLADDTTRSAGTAVPPEKTGKPMKMDQPMSGEMKKEGMTKGDVKKAAAKKQRDMKDVMEKEEKAMPTESTKR